MTIREAIYRIDILKPSGYSQGEKIRWLSELDGTIKKEIIDTHEGSEAYSFNEYDEARDLEKTLLVPAPYDQIYIHYLEMKIDYANGEYNKYNNSRALYTEAYSAFERYYNRTNMPIGRKIKFF